MGGGALEGHAGGPASENWFTGGGPMNMTTMSGINLDPLHFFNSQAAFNAFVLRVEQKKSNQTFWTMVAGSQNGTVITNVGIGTFVSSDGGTTGLGSLDGLLTPEAKLTSFNGNFGTFDNGEGINGEFKGTVVGRISRLYFNESSSKQEQEQNGGNVIDQTNWILGTGALSLEASKGSFRLTNGTYNGSAWSPKYYSSGWTGGSRARITTYNISEIGRIGSRGLVVVGVAIDFGRYRKGEISGGKFGFNTGMGVYGLTGVGTIPATFYFGMEAFYPGGLEGAMNDNVRYQKEIDAIMNTDNRRTHFYILPWGSQKL